MTVIIILLATCLTALLAGFWCTWGDHRATRVGQGATCCRCHVHAFAQRVSADSGFPDTILRVSSCLRCRNGRVRGSASSHRFRVAWPFGRYSAPGRHSDHENKECPTQRRTGSYGITARTRLGCVLTTVATCTPRPNHCQLCCARVLCGGVVGVLNDQVSYKRPVDEWQRESGWHLGERLPRKGRNCCRYR